jgi:hypothetical protein
MFDVLDCYILYMYLLLFVYCIPVLEAPRPERQTKQDFFKKFLCSSVSQRTYCIPILVGSAT